MVGPFGCDQSLRIGKALQVGIPPVLPAQVRYVNASRGSDQNQVSDLFRMLQGEPDTDNPAHGLRDNRGWLPDFLRRQRNQVVKIVDGRVMRLVAQPGS